MTDPADDWMNSEERRRLLERTDVQDILALGRRLTGQDRHEQLRDAARAFLQDRTIENARALELALAATEE
jgi:hypothetical protein